VKLSKGQTVQFIDGECREKGRENKVVGDANLLLPDV